MPWVLVGCAALIFFLYGASAFGVLAAVAALFFLLRYAMMKRIGGITGDTTGAMIELMETLVLVVMALQLSSVT